MLFARFLKKRGLAAPQPKQPVKPEQQESLVEQARNQSDPALRRRAASRLVDLALLQQLWTQDPEAGVREAAADRYCRLLCGAESESIALAALLDAVGQLAAGPVLDRVAVEAESPAVRRAAIERLGSPDLLVRCALEDPLAANRGRAVERLEDKEALEQVVRRIGKKDKTVYRGAREKLRLLAEREALPQRIRARSEEICAKVERLGRLGNWNQDKALLDHLDRQWASIETQAEPQWRVRYQSERERFLKAYDDHRRERAAQIEEQAARERVYAERQALLETLSAASDLADEAEISALLDRTETAWKALPLLPPDRQGPLDARYQRLVQAAAEARKGRANQRNRKERLCETIDRVEQLIKESKALDHKAVKSLLTEGRTLAGDQPETDLAQQFLPLAERLETRLKNQVRHAEQRLKQLPDRLAALEAHLEAGELRKADPLFQSLQAGLELIQASGLPRGSAAEIAKRLRLLAPRLRELQHWRRWGADQHREGLCESMEALRDAELPLEALAERLRALQMDWKALDKSGPPAKQRLWDRFHAASEAVYARCRPYLESRAAEREANRVAREQVCQQVEDFLGKVDWERVDWKRIQRAEREIRQTWATIGHTEGRDRKHLERRFHRSLRQLDQLLDAERKRNQAFKRQLIERVRALAETAGLEAAIRETKALQQEWRTTVPARQKEENRLWQEFRAACDAVFERRAALHQAQADELKENLATREAICAEALACATDEQDPGLLAAVQRDLEERWHATEALPVPRQAAGRLAQRWRECREALAQRRQAGEDGQRRATLDLLQRQADLCERLELSLLGETAEPIDPETAQRRWKELPAHADPELQEALAARFERALAAAQDPEQISELRRGYAANQKTRGRLCLQLEIIAGVQSPPELAQERLELQVARLSERMGEREEDPLTGATHLLQTWYLCGPAPASESLTARFERVRRTLTGAPAEETAVA